MGDCTCIDEMNAKLAEKNSKLQVTFSFSFNGEPSRVLPLIGTEKIETRKRGSACLAIPSFCPFCGISYSGPSA